MLDFIKAYENYLYKVKKASDNTVFSYIRDIRQFSDWAGTCDVALVDYPDRWPLYHRGTEC